MPPPAAARHTTTERPGGEQLAGPELCLVSGCRSFSCTWFGRQHPFFRVPSVFSPQRKFTALRVCGATQMSAPSGDPDEKLRYGLRMIENAYEEKTRALDQEVHPRLPEAHPCLALI